MRNARGLSVGALGRASGIDKSAISRWETGRRQPRVNELEAVLAALNATDGERALAFVRIGAPRAVRTTRQAASDMGLFAPPVVGDLLRAMRMRRGWSEQRLAAHLGVDRSAVAHWESGDRRPGTSELHTLCMALDAREQEVLALTEGCASGDIRLIRLPPPGAGGLSDYMELIHAPSPPGLTDLHYLALEREMWEMAVRTPAARTLLARAYVNHGHQLILEERWASSRVPAARAFAMALKNPSDSITLSRATILSAALAVYGQPTPRPERGIHIIQTFMNWEAAAPENAAWALSDMAKYLTLAGQAGDATPLAEKAARVARQAVNPTESFLRQCDLAQVLMDSGDTEAAMCVIPETGHPVELALVSLLMADACSRVGRIAESHDWLGQALPLIRTHGLKRLVPRAEGLAARF